MKQLDKIEFEKEYDCLKKFIVLVLASVCILTLAGCADKQQNISEEGKNQLIYGETQEPSDDDMIGGSAPQGEVLVSAAVPVESKSISRDSVAVQDPYNYMPKSMTLDSIEKNAEGQQHRKFRGGADAYDLLKGYVDALCETGNFTLADSYYKRYTDSTFFSFALTYTGTGKVSDDKMSMQFKDSVTGDVTLYGILERSSCKGYIDIVKGLEFDDLGLRSDGGTVSVSLPGQSLGAELYRLVDGSYQTGDGRFHVSVGQAQVYRDGTAYTTDAALIRNESRNREELHIDNFYRNDSILFTAPYNSLLTGDVFDTRSIGLNEGGSGYEKYASSMGSFLGWKFSNKLVGVCHDGDYLYCYQDGGNGFEQVAVRVMYWDADREEAVVYLCATFDTSPYEYEALAAVKMETAQATTSSGGSSSGKGDCSYCGGSGRCPSCGGSGKVRNWVPGTREYLTQNCTDCYSPGVCRICGGSGEN